MVRADIGDRLPQVYACRRDPHAFGCNDRSILVHDSVYTQYRLTVDGTYGEAPGCDGARSCCKYVPCNPDTADPSGRTCPPAPTPFWTARPLTRSPSC